jgi:hypothetical protein
MEGERGANVLVAGRACLSWLAGRSARQRHAAGVSRKQAFK